MSPTPEEKAAALAFADALPGCTDTQRHMKVLAAVVKERDAYEPEQYDNDTQPWGATDSAIAFHLIERHAENWDHAGQLMDKWRVERSRALGDVAAPPNGEKTA